MKTAKKNKIAGANDVYDLQSIRAPRLVGRALRTFTALLEGPTGRLIFPKLFRDAGITALREQHFEEPPGFYPDWSTGSSTKNENVPGKELPRKKFSRPPGFQMPTIYDYHDAFKKGRTTPSKVAANLLNAIKDSEQSSPALNAFIAYSEEEILQQAAAADIRYKEGHPLSLLDGVPVAIKDEMDLCPYPTRVGTAFLGDPLPTQDATTVARLRTAGALLIGKSNMHEIGIGVTGLNSNHGTARNPYNPRHYPGGSSSGSATSVAAGFCPVALGADGGGSVRIPAAFCGLFGLKPTFGRISEYGAAPLAWSVSNIGPIAGSATDAAYTYGIIAGADPGDPHTLYQPSPTLKGWDKTNLKGVKIGIFTPWFKHANKEVVKCSEEMVKTLESLGAEIIDITIPELEASRVAHIVTISSEMSQALDQFYAQHGHKHGLDVRINLALARRLTNRDYIKAQRVRTRVMENFRRAFENVDVILTPTTAIPAPQIRDDVLSDGESDLVTLNQITRFAGFANFTGLPAISFPAGYTSNDLPVGVQAMGPAWSESLLLRLALAAESSVERQKPQVYYSLLDVE